MLGSIGDFVGRFAIYITAFLGLIALYFLWVAIREWRTGAQAVFGVERDIAQSEMMGALSRAGILIVVGVLVFGLGWLGQQAETDGETSQTTPTPRTTAPAVTTLTPGASEPAPTFPLTDTPPPLVTDVPPSPLPETSPSAAAPTPQTATVTAFGGVWLRDAPSGGTIVVVPQNAVVEFLEGREFAGGYDWQKVRIVNVPLGSEAQAGQEGWVAAQFLEAGP